MYNMNPILPTLLLLAAPLLLLAQPTEDHHQAVDNVITQLFDGMRAGDSAAVARWLHPDIRMQTATYDKAGQPVLQQGDKNAWLNAIGSMPPGALDERLRSRSIMVDAPLATVVTPYHFYRSGAFSHCGTNAFQLVLTAEGWRIHQVTDTRRREGCDDTGALSADSLHVFIDAWHHAAAVADADVFFGSMSPDGIYLGTDATERWPRDTFHRWAAFAFERESAWDFKAYDRHVYFSPDNETAWWEEMLDTWMGPCRASGVARFTGGRWFITHYHLAVTVPNERMNDYLEMLKK